MLDKNILPEKKLSSVITLLSNNGYADYKLPSGWVILHIRVWDMI